jgi:thiol:disulfide interchange protein
MKHLKKSVKKSVKNVVKKARIFFVAITCFLVSVACVGGFIGGEAQAASRAAIRAVPSNVTVVTPDQVVAKIENSTQPFLLFVYASWCPYCKQQAKLFKKIPPLDAAKMPEIYAVSIDADPYAFSAMLNHLSPMSWKNYLYQGDTSIEEILAGYGSDFSGGIPYMALVKNKKIVKQITNVTPPSEFYSK